MPRTSERGGPQTRARILEAANRLFIERGFDSVTVAQVAKDAGVSSVTVFNHFPTKEDLFLDRSGDVEALLRSAAREPGDVVESLHRAMVGLADEKHAFSGLSERSVEFLRTVAGSPALIARARGIAAGLQRVLADELGPDGRILAVFFVNGYAAVFVETAAGLLAGAEPDALAAGHRARLEALFEALRHGVGDGR